MTAYLEGVARVQSRLRDDGLLKWRDDMDILGSW